MNNEEKLYQMSIGLISGMENPSKDKVEEIITGIVIAVPGITESEIENVKNKIFSEHSVTIEIGNCVEANEYKYRKWFLNKKSELDMIYWERYRKYLIHTKGFPISVVNKMDDILDNLTDLLGNPNSEEEFSRKGLIIGDVQSGKTSNYNGLICKAADAGYKVIVILTGTIESLRKQTQMRMDEGFVGSDTTKSMNKKEFVPIGVGKFDESVRPWSLTSAHNDFKIVNAKNLNVDIKDVSTSVLFVLKKNVTTLKNINRWLTQSMRSGETKIDNSLILIDDESDNASVNTRDIESDPTTINKGIRELLKKFKRSSYVGFTATPFANIFIDPESSEKMETEDLFPKDYIYSLNPPSNYIGARNIFGREGNHAYMLNEIDEDSLFEAIPSNHKRDFQVEYLPEDLEESLCTFLVANAIRDLRGQEKTHRSMIINVSRFSDVQESIGLEVDGYLKNIQNAVKVYAKAEKPLKNKYIQKLNIAFNKNYSNLEFSWEDVLGILNRAIASIVTRVVNQNNKKSLDYENYDDGLRVIAIGGLSLSRGLTLEGLIVSYFARNSKMYDTLMQMGRWFGYRDKYEDLCRIWMLREAIEWYEYISEATDELREDIKRYEDSGLTPLDFGIRVRSDISTLLVTARNKMRSAEEREVNVSISSKVIETPYIYASKEKNENNRISIEDTLRGLRLKGVETVEINNRKIYKNIEKEDFINLISKIDVPIANSKFNINSLSTFIKKYRGKELEHWDIAFATGDGTEENLYAPDQKIRTVRRQCELINDDVLVKLNRSRLGTSNDGKIGIEDGSVEMQEIDSEFEKVKHINKRKLKIQDDYFKSKSRNPLFLIYVIEPIAKSFKDGKKADIKKIEKENLIGFSIGIPKLTNIETRYVKYKVNKVQQRLLEEGQWDIEGYDEE